MSDTSKSCIRSPKRRIYEIENTINSLAREVEKLNDFALKSEIEDSLLTAKLKKDKVRALAAIAKSQAVLSEMEILIAETDLCGYLEKIKNNKKLKLDRGGAKSPNSTRDTSFSSTKSVEVQTEKSMFCKHKRKTSSSKKKSPVDISDDDTVLVATLHDTASVVEKTSLTIGVLNKTPQSDSEVSLSSSMKAEFNKPYTKGSPSETKTHTKKSDKKVSDKKVLNKKVEPKRKSQDSPPTKMTKTVADIKRGLNPGSQIVKK